MVIDYLTQTYSGYVNYTDSTGAPQSKEFIGLAMPKASSTPVSTMTGYSIRLYENSATNSLSYTFTFDDFLLKNVTRPLSVQNVSPPDGAVDVPSGTSVRVTFNKPYS
jgi:hypothetical protein